MHHSYLEQQRSKLHCDGLNLACVLAPAVELFYHCAAQHMWSQQTQQRRAKRDQVAVLACKGHRPVMVRDHLEASPGPKRRKEFLVNVIKSAGQPVKNKR